MLDMDTGYDMSADLEQREHEAFLEQCRATDTAKVREMFLEHGSAWLLRTVRDICAEPTA